ALARIEIEHRAALRAARRCAVAQAGEHLRKAPVEALERRVRLAHELDSACEGLERLAAEFVHREIPRAEGFDSQALAPALVEAAHEGHDHALAGVVEAHAVGGGVVEAVHALE